MIFGMTKRNKNRDLLSKERIHSCKSKFFPLRVDQHVNWEPPSLHIGQPSKEAMVELLPLKVYLFTIISALYDLEMTKLQPKHSKRLSKSGMKVCKRSLVQ